MEKIHSPLIRGTILMLLLTLSMNLFAENRGMQNYKPDHFPEKTNLDQQQKTVTGKVTSESGDSLPGVTVAVKGTTQGTITDFDGNYSISNVPSDGILSFSFVGMVAQEISVQNQTTINIVLEEETIGLDEVVAIGYGVQKKSLATGAISSVKSENIESVSITNAEQALQGRTAGVTVMQTSGSPGSSMAIRIRGVSSNGDASPLYIVDGTKMSDISSIAPQDIESMEVLKDAASTAIYGAEGGNGVVIITTKSGKVGTSTLSYDMQYTIEQVGDIPDLLNAEEYIQYNAEAGRTVDPTGFDTNWADAIFETGQYQNHHISYSTGTEKAKTMLSGSYLTNDGIVSGDKDTYERLTLRVNGDYKINNWLKIGNNVSFTHSKKSGIAENDVFGGVLSGALMLDPVTPIVYTDNSQIPSSIQAIVDEHEDEVVRDEAGNIYGISQYVTGKSINPFVVLANTKGKTIGDNVVGSFFADITPIEDLTITSRVGFNINYSNNHSWNPVYYHSSESFNTVPTVEENYNSSYFWQWENFATYNKTIGEHSLNVVAGIAAQQRTSRTTDVYGGPMNVVNDENYADFDYIASDDLDQIGGHTTDDTQYSYFGRFTYNYKDKYVLQGTIRRDGASLSYLPKQGRWGTFPSFSLGWILSEEDFFSSSTFDFLRLRGSWGENGSLSNLGNYSYYGFITSSGNRYYVDANGNLLNYSEPSRLNNPSLTWETSVQTNIGFDVRAFDSKFSISADYYHKKTTDLLTSNTPPYEAGNSAASINAGDVVNKGIEVELGYSDNIGDLDYDLSFNISKNKNEVTYLDPTVTRLRGASASGNSWTATYVEVGYPIWYFRGYKTDGINPETGDPNIIDVNKDGSINSSDYTMIGNPNPDVTFGGNINLKYKDFDLAIFMQGSIGNDVLVGFMRNDRAGVNRPKFIYDDRWTETNTNASMPSAATDANNFNSDLLVFDGSYLRVKQIQLGYNLPKEICSKIKAQKIRAYVSGENLFTFTKYPGMDPELGSTGSGIGIDRGFYPAAKKFVFGASISF